MSQTMGSAAPSPWVRRGDSRAMFAVGIERLFSIRIVLGIRPWASAHSHQLFERCACDRSVIRADRARGAKSCCL
jgi:hypothetical protein